MREQTIIMHSTPGSSLFSEIASNMETVLFRGGAFVLSIGCAYLAICYGIPMPALEKIEENNS
jgi:hypothetical protein